jgi:hypothetical protein
LSESIKSEKADMLIEAFDAMLIAGGVEVATIVEAKDNASAEHDLEESVGKYDTLVDENISLKEENDALIKLGVISELKEGLSIVESEKFGKLAALVEFDRSATYAEKLETIKESIKGSADKEEILEESVETAEKSVYSHLI